MEKADLTLHLQYGLYVSVYKLYDLIEGEIKIMKGAMKP